MTYMIIVNLENGTNAPLTEKITGQTADQVRALRESYRASAPEGSTLTTEVTREY